MNTKSANDRPKIRLLAAHNWRRFAEEESLKQSATVFPGKIRKNKY